MQFSKLIASSFVFAISSMAMAAPAPEAVNPLERRVAELEARTEDLVARAGWTCSFLGAKGCQVKCVGLGKSGGYCNKENVCVCHSG